MYIQPGQKSYLLRKISICAHQDKINELVEWIQSDRKGKSKQHLLDDIPVHSLDSCDTTYFRSPLHMAILMQDVPLIKKLLDKNTNPLSKNPEGKDSIYFAIQTGNIDIFHMIDKYDRHKGTCYFCVIV